MSTTILINPRTLQAEEVENPTEIITLQLLVREDEWVGLFDQIEIWRSLDTSQGPYHELTADEWKPARVPEIAPDAPDTPVTGRDVIIVGTTLKIRVDDVDDYVVTFTGTDPLTYAECATQVTDQSAGKFLAYVTDDGDFVVEGKRAGTGAVLEVTGGDAAVLLGLPHERPDSLSYGKDARLNLIRGREEYIFTDLRGNAGALYRTRFRQKNTSQWSEFSQPVGVNQAFGISTANVVVGYLDLVKGDGRPLGNAQVKVYSPTVGELVEDRLVTGPEQMKLTDQNGHAEFALVRGVKYTVALTGTDIVRDIVAPTDESIKLFKLLGESVGTSDDVFVVQVPDIVYAERRTL